MDLTTEIMISDGRINALDLDSMIHIVAAVQWKNGNRDRPEAVKDHVRTFYATIRKKAACQYSIAFYQGAGFENFRKAIWW